MTRLHVVPQFLPLLVLFPRKYTTFNMPTEVHYTFSWLYILTSLFIPICSGSYFLVLKSVLVSATGSNKTLSTNQIV